MTVSCTTSANHDGSGGKKGQTQTRIVEKSSHPSWGEVLEVDLKHSEDVSRESLHLSLLPSSSSSSSSQPLLDSTIPLAHLKPGIHTNLKLKHKGVSLFVSLCLIDAPKDQLLEFKKLTAMDRDRLGAGALSLSLRLGEGSKDIGNLAVLQQGQQQGHGHENGHSSKPSTPQTGSYGASSEVVAVWRLYPSEPSPSSPPSPIDPNLLYHMVEEAGSERDTSEAVRKASEEALVAHSAPPTSGSPGIILDAMPIHQVSSFSLFIRHLCLHYQHSIFHPLIPSLTLSLLYTRIRASGGQGRRDQKGRGFMIPRPMSQNGPPTIPPPSTSSTPPPPQLVTRPTTV